MEKGIQIWLKDPRIEKDGDFYVAYNDQLQLVGCGINEEEAVENLRNVIRTSCGALVKEGILFETLNNKGIEFKEVEYLETKQNEVLKPLLLGV